MRLSLINCLSLIITLSALTNIGVARPVQPLFGKPWADGPEVEPKSLAGNVPAGFVGENAPPRNLEEGRTNEKADEISQLEDGSGRDSSGVFADHSLKEEPNSEGQASLSTLQSEEPEPQEGAHVPSEKEIGFEHELPKGGPGEDPILTIEEKPSENKRRPTIWLDDDRSDITYAKIKDPGLRNGLKEADDVYGRTLASEKGYWDWRLAINPETRSKSAVKYASAFRDYDTYYDKYKNKGLHTGAKGVMSTGLTEEQQAEWTTAKNAVDDIKMLEKQMEAENLRMTRRAKGMEARFGKWDPKTGKFANEDTLVNRLAQFQNIPKNGPENYIELRATAMKEVAGLDAAKTFMKQTESDRALLEGMYGTREMRNIAWYQRLINWVMGESHTTKYTAKIASAAMQEDYEEALKREVEHTQQPGFKSAKATHELTEDYMNKPTVGKVFGYENVKEGEKAPRGLSSEVGKDYGELSDESLDYLTNRAVESRAAAANLFGNNAHAIKAAEQAYGPIRKVLPKDLSAVEKGNIQNRIGQQGTEEGEKSTGKLAALFEGIFKFP